MTTKRIKLIVAIFFFTFIIAIGIAQAPKRIDNYTQYDCDVKYLSLSTDIQISKDSEKIGTVSGNIFRIVEDPLTMKDTDNNRIAYAGDTYHLISQDSHVIVVGDTVTAEMVGLFKLFGERYDIYNANGEKIARAEFNYLNTGGEVYNADGTLIATYGSFVLFNDFNVKISNESNIDTNTLLMIFCSYFSDQKYDRS